MLSRDVIWLLLRILSVVILLDMCLETFEPVLCEAAHEFIF